MKFYDEECEGHKKIKSVAGPMHEGVCTVYFESVV